MMIPVELQFFLKNLINKIINLEHIPMKLLAFLHAVKHVLKVIEDVWSID
jgi:hypothetical protein